MRVKKIIVDVDNTITIDESSSDYKLKKPNILLINKLKKFKDDGYEIVLYTARNMNTFNNDISKINSVTLPILIEWLNKNEVYYDGIIVGKPWCGHDGFYIDDKAIRPDEFVKMTEEQIKKLIKS